jgi:hypothetical protein
MTSARSQLPNRRAIEPLGFKYGSLNYAATASRFPNGDIAELFEHHKSGQCGEHPATAAAGPTARPACPAAATALLGRRRSMGEGRR